MTFVLYDYVNGNGVNQIEKWARTLQVKDLGRLNAKLDMLSRVGPILIPDPLAGTSVSGIQKLKVKGNVQYRPMLCAGPISVDLEYTLLIGAKEVGSKLQPKNVEQTARDRKVEVIADPARRRLHERVS